MPHLSYCSPLDADYASTDPKLETPCMELKSFDLLDENGDVITFITVTASQSSGPPELDHDSWTFSPKWAKANWNLGMSKATQRLERLARCENKRRLKRAVSVRIYEGFRSYARRS